MANLFLYNDSTRKVIEIPSNGFPITFYFRKGDIEFKPSNHPPYYKDIHQFFINNGDIKEGSSLYYINTINDEIYEFYVCTDHSPIIDYTQGIGSSLKFKKTHNDPLRENVIESICYEITESNNIEEIKNGLKSSLNQKRDNIRKNTLDYILS